MWLYLPLWLVVSLLLLLLGQLLVLAWEGVGMPVHELGVRDVVRQRYGAVAALILADVVATSLPMPMTLSSAVLASV